jgi:hypothetical protein
MLVLLLEQQKEKQVLLKKITYPNPQWHDNLF